MEESPDSSAFAPEKFRQYLRLLAEAGLDRRLRGRLDPSDVVQETLLEAQQAMKRFEGDTFEAQAAWLRKILAHNLANAARDHGRAKRDVGQECSLERSFEQSSRRLEAWLKDAKSSPSKAAMRREDVLRLSDALAVLPGDEREALILRYWQDRSLAEIGTALALSRFAASRLLRRALAALRAELKGTW